MLIRDAKKIGDSKSALACLSILNAGMEAVQPSKVLSNFVKLSKHSLKIGTKSFKLHQYNRVIVVGFGKGSSEMASVVEKILTSHIHKGLVIDIKSKKLNRIKVLKGDHPILSKRNVSHTEKILKMTSNLSSGDLVVCLVAGGGSALFTKPNISLSSYQKLNERMLKSGARIQEVNTVRKHLDLVKGGRFAVHCYPATVVSLMISDVPGNKKEFIASGPTVKDKTTNSDAKKVMKKYKLGSVAKCSETLKDSKYFQNVHNFILIDNSLAVDAMKKQARKLGLRPIVLSTSFTGEASLAGKKLISKLKKNTAVIAAGETTVTVSGKGKGGRNQELVLGALSSIKEGVAIGSVGTDGLDNSDVAGAVADSSTIKLAEKKGINWKKYLKLNDSYTFWKKLGKQVKTGPTGTNVADVMVVVKR
jgi:glycerate-2-kinase